MKRIEIGIVALCLIVAAFSIQRLFFNRTQSRNMSSLGAIGTVTPMGADVRLKSQTNDWAALENTEPVVKYDRVFTGPQSRALVSLESGSHLLVSPQTLVIISENEGLKELSLESGAFVSKMKKGDRIAIRQGAKSFVIEGDGQALIRKTDQNIHIGLLSGDLKVQENQKEDNLKAGDEIEWSEIEGLLKDKVKNAISLMSPMDGLLWSATDAKIDFTWSRSKAGESSI